MCSYSLGLYEKSMPAFLSIREKLEQTKKAGFDFMEVSIDESDEKQTRLEWTKRQRLEIINAVNDTGVRIATMCLSGHRKYPLGSEDEKTRNKSMEIMSRAIDLAVDLGIRIIQLAGYDEYYNPSNVNTKKYFLENLQKSVQIAAGKGIILAFETMETEFIDTVEKAMQYISEINSPYLQIYPDIGNITNAALKYGMSLSDDMKTGTGHIAAVHLKETLPGKFREIDYGKGHVDFVKGIKTAYELGVKLYVGEFWYAGQPGWQEQLKYANAFLHGKFSRYFAGEQEND